MNFKNPFNFLLAPLTKRYLYLKYKVFKVIGEIHATKHLIHKNTINIPLLLSQRTLQQKATGEKSTKVAIFFDLEYFNQSAIAEFSIQTFCSQGDKFHIFTKFSGNGYANLVLSEIAKKLKINKKELCVFDVDMYAELNRQFDYAARVFVLGDSFYNLTTFEAALSLYENKERNYLYFHDGLYVNLLYAWILKYNTGRDGSVWGEFVLHYYPSLEDISSLTTEFLLNNNIHMIAPIVALTGCSRIITNADNCLPIIEREAETKPIEYIKAFLPIPDYRNVVALSYRAQNNFIVGHFGIPNTFKKIETLIEAVGLLYRQYGAKLLLAGYGVKHFVESLSTTQRQFILYEDSPSLDRMLSLMKGVDVAVQLRWPITGQASGVISELLGLGSKCITTKGFVNECFRDYVVELSPDVTAEELMQTIVENRGNMKISSDEHAELLEKFSYEASAQLIFCRVTNQSVVDRVKQEDKNEKPISQPATQKRKLRILYGASHRILRFEEIPLFIEAGFEVVPVKAHWEIFNVQEPEADNPAHALYPNWRKACTLSDDVIEKIQAVDILKYQNLNAASGKVTQREAALINEHIDIIYIPNLLPAVPRVLQWFKGLTLFRVYGEGNIMTYDEWAAESGANMQILHSHDARYATMLMLYALNGPEHASILGSNVFHVGPCVTESRLKGEWKGKNATNVCNTALSYIGENPHWTELYHQFCQEFNDIPLRFLGKNNKSFAATKNDPRVIGIIRDDQQFMDLLTDCRCLLDPGTSPFHTHYTPLEAMLIGIPVIFLANSGMGREILRVFSAEELTDCGMCDDFKQAKVVIDHCLHDIDYAQQLAINQRKIAKKLFSPSSVLSQIKVFSEAAPGLVARARAFKPTRIESANSSGLLSADECVYVSAGEALMLKAPPREVVKYTIKTLLKTAHGTYRAFYPKRWRAMTAEFVFKTCFPSTYENVTRLRTGLGLGKRSADIIQNEVKE